MYCLIEIAFYENIEYMNHIVMVSKSKEELEEIKTLLEKKFENTTFKVIDL